MTSQEYDDLYIEVSELHMRVDKSPEASEAVKRQFAEGMLPLDSTPPASSLRKLRRLFYSLPDAEQRGILNGWKPCPQRPTREAILHDKRSELQVCRVMEIVPFPPDEDGTNDCYIGQTFDVAVVHSGIRVLIAEGTSMTDAIDRMLRAIRSLVNYSTKEFEEELPENYFIAGNHEKSGSPESPVTPTIGLTRVAKAMAPTAA